MAGVGVERAGQGLGDDVRDPQSHELEPPAAEGVVGRHRNAVRALCEGRYWLRTRVLQPDDAHDRRAILDLC